MSKQTHIFLHIPKTAGTTLHQVMARQYKQGQFYTVASSATGVTDFQALPETERRQMHLVKGHFDFGLHRNVPNFAAYLTMFREPAARLRSYHRFIERIPEHYCHELVVSQKLSLADCLRQGVDVMMDNGQTRMIAGQLYQHPFGSCPDEMLTTAKENLRHYFAVVGVTERFDESLLWLQRVLGWRYAYYAQRNVAPSKGQPLSAEVQALIEETNWMDKALYQFANALLDAHIGAWEGNFAHDYTKFQRWNGRLRPLVRLYDEVGQRLKR